MFAWLSRLFRNPAPAPHPLAVRAGSDDPAERAKAAAELGELREPWVPAELGRLLSDYSEPVREAAKAALRLQEGAALAVLLEALKSPRLEVSLAAADLLGELRAPESVEPLLVVFKFSERVLQNAAWRALERCGAVALPALWAARDEVQPWARERIEELLAKGLDDAARPAPPPSA